MWKPGTSKPGDPSLSPGASTPKKTNGKLRQKLRFGTRNGSDMEQTSVNQNTPSSSTPRKRLSGGTMNMRFMKRRKDAINTNTNRDSGASASSPRTSLSHRTKMENSSAMDIEGNEDSSTERDCKDRSNYRQATSVDMYGMEAQLIGRRSFRGFNAPMERMWKDSKLCLESRNATNRRKKVSDEELILRYQDKGNQRDTPGRARGIGNLEKKNQNKKRY